MPSHYIEHILPYTPACMFDLVADVEQYPTFLPWCEYAAIHERHEEGGKIIAELGIHFQGIKGRYVSAVSLDREQMKINVELLEGPFHHLYNAWEFLPHEEGCLVAFTIDFKLRSSFFEKIMDLMMDRVLAKMIQAFIRRADELYMQ